MTDKKIVRLAMVRKNSIDPCPFGLTIPFGCDHAGEIINKMAPIEILGPKTSPEEKQALIAANNHILRWKGQGKCKYADKVLEEKNAVECDWGTNTAGEAGGVALEGSPWYYKHFSGVGIDGLYSFPLGYFSDNSIDRGMYYGMYSLEGIASSNEDSVNIVKSTNKLEYEENLIDKDLIK